MGVQSQQERELVEMLVSSLGLEGAPDKKIFQSAYIGYSHSQQILSP